MTASATKWNFGKKCRAEKLFSYVKIGPGPGVAFPDLPDAGPGTGPGLLIPSKLYVGLAEMVGFVDVV